MTTSTRIAEALDNKVYRDKYDIWDQAQSSKAADWWIPHMTFGIKHNQASQLIGKSLSKDTQESADVTTTKNHHWRIYMVTHNMVTLKVST